MNQAIRHFLDSSALLKLYVEEPGSEAVMGLMESAEPGSLAVSRLAEIEIVSVLARRARGGDISTEDANAGLRLLAMDLDSRLTVVELGVAVAQRSVGLVRHHALKAADALQLACALMCEGDGCEPGPVTLVSADRELNAAAEQEGLGVLDPAGG